MTRQSVPTDGPSIPDTPSTLPAVAGPSPWDFGLFVGFVDAWANDPNPKPSVLECDDLPGFTTRTAA